MTESGCVFCEKIENEKGLLTVIRECAIFEPLNPVVTGHLLVVPIKHVADCGVHTWVTSTVMEIAAMEANSRYENYNIITSKGRAATQSIFHFHVHIIPRIDGDGLKLPWTDQHKG